MEYQPHKVYSDTVTNHNSSYGFLSSLNATTQLVMTFTKDQLIQDSRFITIKASEMSTGVSHVNVPLPSTAIDIGQYNQHYITDEKGMLLARHFNYFSANTEALHRLLNLSITTCYIMCFGDSGSDNKLIGAIQSNDDKNLKWFENAWNTIGSFFGLEFSGWDDLFQTALTDFIIRDDGIYVYETTNDGTGVPACIEFNKTNLTVDTLYTILDTMYLRNTKGVDDKKAGTKFSFKIETHEDTGIIKTGVSYNISDIPKYIVIDLQPVGDDYYIDLSSEGESGKLADSVNTLLHGIATYDKRGAAAVCGLAFAGVIQELFSDDTLITVGSASNVETLYSHIRNIAEKYGFNGDEFIYFLTQINRLKDVGIDIINDGNDNVYFFDEYAYYLRDYSTLSTHISSERSSDLADILYYWDSYYLPKLTFNTEVVNSVQAQYKNNYNGGDSAYEIWCMYQKYLETNVLSMSEYSFSKFLENYSIGYIDKSLKLYAPFVYELQAQLKSYDEYILDNSIIEQYFGEASSLYNWLSMDTIVIYPSYVNADIREFDPASHKVFDLKMYMPAAETIAAKAPSAKQYGDIADIVIDYDPIQLILALQCNTDYEHNYLNLTINTNQTVTHVSKEELMDKADQFFTNPVTSLEYILSGFLYKMHTTIATGGLGSVFSANWLLESDIYKWVINRYVAIVTIIVVVLLLLKLTQFAMSKTHNYAEIGRAVIGILAMCMVPVLVFNGFIWVFNATSLWALENPTNKMLLSEVNATALERVDSDPGVTAELTAFREQFGKIQGEYDGITFEEMTAYSLVGPVYKQVPLSYYMERTKFSTSKELWYSSGGFTPVNYEYYTDSMFYYFYDYIKSEFYDYCANNPGTMIGSTSNYLPVLGSNRNLLKDKGDSSKYESWRQAVLNINAAESAMVSLTQEFVQMLNDTQYVYGNSIVSGMSDKYGGAQVKDLAGVYNLFRSDINNDGTITSTSTYFDKAWNNIKSSAWRRAMNDADIMIAEDGIIPKLWTDQTVLPEYFKDLNKNGGRREGISTGSGTTEYPIMTSKLDMFSSSLNGTAASNFDARTNSYALTPLEEKLCAVTEDIYATTIKALEYHTNEVKNESAIVLMAWIATFKVSEAFGIAPAGPIPQTITLDTVIRTAFIRDLDTVSANVNTMYALINQGDSIGKVIIVLVLETVVSIASILRIGIILFLTVGSFVVLALRLLHKAPQTTDLIYGIVGNVLALLFLHVITLLLVVCAVEWVAGATNAIPSLVLDIIVFAFIILMSVLLFKLVKNLVRDAINMGGAKIKAGVHSMISGITNLITKTAGINSLATELAGDNVSMNADNVSQEIAQQQQQEEQLQDRRERAEGMLADMSRVEAASAIEAPSGPHGTSSAGSSNGASLPESSGGLTTADTQLPLSNKVAANLVAESGVTETVAPIGKVTEAAGSVSDALHSGKASKELVGDAATIAANAYAGPVAGKVVEAAMETKVGSAIAKVAADRINHSPAGVALKVASHTKVGKDIAKAADTLAGVESKDTKAEAKPNLPESPKIPK